MAASDVRSLDDLQRLPFTTKSDLRDNYPFGLFAVPVQDIARIHASSGTTGKPTVAGYTAADLALWGEVMARSLSMASVTASDIVHNAYGYGLFTGGLGVHIGAERIGAAVVPISGGMTKRQVMLLEDVFLPEIVDPDSGETLPAGEEGELVITTLTKEAMPVIRYRTRDRTRLIPEPCACGRTLVRMDRITGRTDDMLIVRGVNVFPQLIERTLFSIEDLEPQYQIVVERAQGLLDTLEVIVGGRWRCSRPGQTTGAPA